MKKTIRSILSAIFFVFLIAGYAAAHCEIPCGIYDDEMRIEMIAEHIGTIEKSMKQIIALKGSQPIDYNQLVRWISNKEHHADEIQEIAAQYFMTQRIKFDTGNYSKKIGLLHKILVYAMKCKQTTDLSYIDSLRSTLKAFRDLYFVRK